MERKKITKQIQDFKAEPTMTKRANECKVGQASKNDID